MFSRKEQILRKTGPNGIGRFQYLTYLVKEYETTASLEAKQQVLANLANFCYDPINYDFIRHLNIIDLFLKQLSEPEDEDLLLFAVAGLCNLSADPENSDIIIQKNGIGLISRHLSHRNKDIPLNVLTTLIFIFKHDNKHYVTTEIVHRVLKLNDVGDGRFKNLVTIFLEDYCFPQQIELAKNWKPPEENLENIPLPSS